MTVVVGRLISGISLYKLLRKKCQACSFSLLTIAQASGTAGIVGNAELMREVANSKIGEKSIGEDHQFKKLSPQNRNFIAIYPRTP